MGIKSEYIAAKATIVSHGKILFYKHCAYLYYFDDCTAVSETGERRSVGRPGTIQFDSNFRLLRVNRRSITKSSENV